jgi:hypothetical protein
MLVLNVQSVYDRLKITYELGNVMFDHTPTSFPTNEVAFLHKHFVDFCYSICIPNPIVSHFSNHFLFLCLVRCAKTKYKTICPSQWWSCSPCNIWSWLVVCSQLWHHWKLCVLLLLLSNITQNTRMPLITNMYPIANWKPMKKIEQGPIAFLSNWTNY